MHAIKESITAAARCCRAKGVDLMSVDHEIRALSALALIVVLSTATSGCTAHTSAATASSAPAGNPGTANVAAEEPQFGTVNFPVSCSAPAQEQFNRAVGMLHSFFYPETVKAFNRVLELDPGCAMAYWGVARSQPPNPLVVSFPPGTFERGLEAISKGKTLGPKTQRERDWLDAAETYFSESNTVPYDTRVKRYEKAMEGLAQRYPDDAEASIFYALALLESADMHDKTFGNQFKAATVLERLAPAHPNHPGISHYIIHAYDYSDVAGKGLAAANEYAKIAPSAPHALHMPSHIYSMLGMWTQSIDSNQATLARAHDYAVKNLPPGVILTAEPHSFDFIEYAYLQLGKDMEAKAVLARAAAVTKTNVPTITVDAALAAIPVRYALERGAWEEASALEPRPSAYPYAEAVRFFGRAVGAARLGDPAHVEQARGDVAKLIELRGKYTAKADPYWAEQTDVLIESASAWLARAQHDDGDALRLLRKAADLEDASEKHVSMENRLFPMREQLGYLLLELQQPEKALAEFEASLKSTPNRLRGLYGAAKAAERAGSTAVARVYYQKLCELTAGANGQRMEIAEAKQFVARTR
jgi:tetratricopeptide (TPR) repeat protein